jgi:hypothetical protein
MPLTGAVCPTHPERPSVGTCARCGRFLCGECRAFDPPPTCAACLARGRDAMLLGNQGLTAGGTLSLSLKLMRATAPVLATAVAIGTALGLAIELGLPELPRSAGNLIDRVYELTAGLVLDVAVVAAMLEASQGRTLKPGEALQEGLSAWGRVLKYRFLSGLLILVFTLLLIVPGILKALSYAFVTILAWQNHPDPLEGSAALTHGRRGALLGALTLAFLVFFAMLLVPLVTVGMVTEAAPAFRVPGAVVSNLAVNLGGALLDASVVAAYLLLTNEVARGQR